VAPSRLLEYALASFPLEEFVCRCGCREILLDTKLALIVFRVRCRLPNADDYKITSGYRCVAHNSRVPGASPRSQHTLGRAADQIAKGLTSVDIWRAIEDIEELEVCGVGLYRGSSEHIHIDTRGYKARWGCINGRMTTFEEALQYE